MIEKALLEMHGYNDTQRLLLGITWRMLEAIHTGDVHTYLEYCRPELTCFEDVCAHRIDGVEFHIGLIRQMAAHSELRPIRFDILTPHVKVYSNSAIVTYTRLMTYDTNGKPHWRTFNETRVFVRNSDNEEWKMAHFHRTPV